MVLTRHPRVSRFRARDHGVIGMVNPADKVRLERLGKRIDTLRDARKPGRPGIEDHHSQAHLAWRMVIELVAGIVIGFGMGFGLDSLFGTMPVFLVMMTLLGFAAGVRTMLRSADEVRKEMAGDPPARNREDDLGK